MMLNHSDKSRIESIVSTEFINEALCFPYGSLGHGCLGCDLSKSPSKWKLMNESAGKLVFEAYGSITSYKEWGH